MKNPNGYWCIKHLSGSRRNPWAFVATENGSGVLSTATLVEKSTVTVYHAYTISGSLLAVGY